MKKKTVIQFVFTIIFLMCLCGAFVFNAQGYYEEIYIDCDEDGYTDTELEAEFDTDTGTVSVAIAWSECEKVVIPPVLRIDNWDDWYESEDEENIYERPYTVTSVTSSQEDCYFKSIVIPSTVTYIEEKSVGYYTETVCEEYYDDYYGWCYEEYDVKKKTENFTVYCVGDSAADMYALSEGFNTVYLKDFSLCEASLSMESFCYTGEDIEPEATVSYMNEILNPGEDYHILYFSNRYIGKAYAVIVGTDEFCGVIINEFEITAVPASEVIVSPIKAQYYTGWEIEPYFTLTYLDEMLYCYEDYTYTVSSNINPGKGKIVITFCGEMFTGEITVEFDIIIEPMKELTVTALSDSEVYLQWDHVPCGKFYIYRYSPEKNKYVRIAKTANTYYTDTGRTQLGTYKYAVKAVKSSKSNTALKKSVTTLLRTPELTLKTKNKSATLTWKSNPEADGYQIYRSSNWYGTKKAKTIRDNSVTKWTNKKLNNDYDYFFSIRAYKKTDGKTIYSNMSPTKYSGKSPSRINDANLISHRSFPVYNVQGKKTQFMYNINLSDSDIKLLDKFIKKHFKEGMTREEQLQVTLDWINKNVTYALDENWLKISGKSWVEAIFKYKLGQCAQYNGAMAAMMAYLGYDVQVVMGFRGTWKTNYWQHFWAEVKINGVTYVVETGNQGRSGNWSYLVREYSEAPKYIKNQKNI